MSAPPPIDPAFVFDWSPPTDGPDDDATIDTGQRWSTWRQVDPLCRGPEPRPDWVVTSEAAVDTDLGVLKTGKEADAFLIEREVPGSQALGETDVLGEMEAVGQSVVMVAKRYRDDHHRSFTRTSAYTQGRRVRDSRDQRALAKGSAHGRAVAAGLWAQAEWEALGRCWSAGLAVPYPVQIDGTELLMEWIREPDGQSAPRLVQTRPAPDLLTEYAEQAMRFLVGLADLGYAHGDLSPYNILAADERLVVIDLPQIVDLAANPEGMAFLHRDCLNLAAWFTTKGHPLDGEELFAEVAAHTW